MHKLNKTHGVFYAADDKKNLWRFLNFKSDVKIPKKRYLCLMM